MRTVTLSFLIHIITAESRNISALHGVVALKDGSVVDVSIGEDENDAVVGISDLLIHLSQEQLEKKGNKVVEGEDLNILVGSMPLEAKTEEEKKTKELVQANVLKILKDAGLVGVRQDGTANYYYLTLRDSTRSLMELGYRLEEFM